MSIIRLVEVDMMTGGMTTLEALGSLRDTYPMIEARINTRPGRRAVLLTDIDLFLGAAAELTERQVEALGPPEEQVTRLPVPTELVYDPATGWFTAAPRPAFEDAMGKTKAELVANMVGRGVPQNLAETTVDAREGEYDAYDPLEGVHPYGTPIEDIAQAAIVAAEERAARRAG